MGLKNRKRFKRMCENRRLSVVSLGESKVVNVVRRWWEGQVYKQRLLGRLPYSTFTDPVDWEYLEQLVVEWDLVATFEHG